MRVLLHLLICMFCTVIRAHTTVVEVLHKLLLVTQKENGAGESILQCHGKFPQSTPWSHERHKGMQTGTGTGQVLDGSSTGLNTSSKPADRAQVNQGVGKVLEPIAAPLWETPARNLGKHCWAAVMTRVSTCHSWSRCVPAVSSHISASLTGPPPTHPPLPHRSMSESAINFTFCWRQKLSNITFLWQDSNALSYLITGPHVPQMLVCTDWPWRPCAADHPWPAENFDWLWSSPLTPPFPACDAFVPTQTVHNQTIPL